MTWQEYEQMVFLFAQQLFSMNRVVRNVRLQDTDTHGLRQLDTLVEIDANGTIIKVLFDAKMIATKLDVTHIRAVRGLADDVSADLAVLVSSHGFTDNAIAKANALRVRTFHLSEDNARRLAGFDWKLCPGCLLETISVDQAALGVGTSYFSGVCKSCKLRIVRRLSSNGNDWYYITIPLNKTIVDRDGAIWTNDGDIVFLPKERHSL